MTPLTDLDLLKLFLSKVAKTVEVQGDVQPVPVGKIGFLIPYANGLGDFSLKDSILDLIRKMKVIVILYSKKKGGYIFNENTNMCWYFRKAIIIGEIHEQ